MTIAASIRSVLNSRRTRRRALAYASASSDAQREAAQLDLLNEAWKHTFTTVPYYSELIGSAGLPGRFASLEEFATRVPVADRKTFQEQRERLVSSERPAQLVRITGGSSAEPVRIPSWKSEFRFARPDPWLARSWYGIRPESRLFLLWGHSHLLGTGVRGWIAARRRKLEDRLLGYLRFSAYDLSRASLRRAAEALIRFRPEYVSGYSVALDLFARANAESRAALRAAGVKLVVATAEGFPAPDSQERLADLFACPIGMEYGAVETNIVAHTHPEGGYRVLWRSHLVDAERVGGQHRLRVTSLYPRCVPLVRYELGDEIELKSGAAERVASVLSFERVIGRCNDYVVLGEGSLVHSEAFTHAVRSCEEVLSYQVVQEDSDLRLLYTAERELDSTIQTDIRQRLARVHGELQGIRFERVGALHRTIAGKTPMILRR
jgi:phenylacetate-coenzyme A ligase PaaK-like adenylate-forming protein